ncbi:hypothetical protein [Aestuariibacter sp. A3R04]|uniref:hypothetical protein n=1 Tax=Aestuariibacter sp. A3R04 TaxID=2841571 RepID=UPI001C096C29|nr:hypothetical protein [Aestuariibacter sp. A3R04]MBU3020464.1 hypothetical protein [Aestuariibacter sp. A3R04]
MKKAVNVISILLLSCLWPLTGLAKEVFKECNACSVSERKGVATGWGTSNLTYQDVVNNTVQKVTIIDLAEREASTFNVSAKLVQLPNGYPNAIVGEAIEASTSVFVKQEMSKLDAAFVSFKDDVQSKSIPSELIPDAWQFVNCAYCENDLSDYLNAQLRYQTETLARQILTVGNLFGISTTGLPNKYKVPLESGGYVVIEAKLYNEPSELRIEVKKVVDSDNNSVPLVSTNLRNLVISLKTANSAANVNSYINVFKFYVPMRTGTVVIRDCLPGDHDPCKQ